MRMRECGATQKELLSMDQRGVGLENSKQQEFNTDSERLAELSTTFGNHILDATKETAAEKIEFIVSKESPT